jgi:hypothetical protein
MCSQGGSERLSDHHLTPAAERSSNVCRSSAAWSATGNLGSVIRSGRSSLSRPSLVRPLSVDPPLAVAHLVRALRLVVSCARLSQRLPPLQASARMRWRSPMLPQGADKQDRANEENTRRGPDRACVETRRNRHWSPRLAEETSSFTPCGARGRGALAKYLSTRKRLNPALASSFPQMGGSFVHPFLGPSALGGPEASQARPRLYADGRCKPRFRMSLSGG